MRTDKLTAAVAALLAVAYFAATEQIMEPPIGDPIGPKAIPRLLALGLLLSAFLLLIENRAKRKYGQPTKQVNLSADGGENRQLRPRPLFIPILVAVTAIYLLAFTWLGYPISTAIYLVALMFMFNPGKPWTNLAAATGFSFASYSVFTRFFGAQLPPGLLPF